MDPKAVVERYFEAMRAGASGGGELLALFADDAVYIEPFGGEERTHVGKKDIEACFRGGWEATPPDLRLEVRRIDVDGDTVRSEWTCTSPAFDAPVKGIDVCVVRDGLIRRLEVRFA